MVFSSGSNPIDADEFIALVALLVFVCLQFWQRATNLKNPWWYTLARYSNPRDVFHVYGIPPNWVYSIVWPILFGLMIASIFIYYVDYKTILLGTGLYGQVLLWFFINVLLNKLWIPLFFSKEKDEYSMPTMFVVSSIVLVLILGTAVVVLILFAIEGAWLSFGLWIAYPLWCVYALFLNVQFASIGSNLFTQRAHIAFSQMEKDLASKRYGPTVYAGNQQ